MATTTVARTGLAGLIPDVFFTPPPITANPAHGRIGVYQGPVPALRGRILVTWERGCPIFNENLTAARTLKVAGHGNYFGNEVGGWLFNAAAARAVLDTFPATLVVDPAVKSLAEQQQSKTTTEPVKQLHGKITYEAGKWVLAFGGVFQVPRDRFSRYVDASRSIKHACQGSPGWNNVRKVWVFAREAAGRLVQAFPASLFEHAQELAGDAALFPAPEATVSVAEDGQAGPACPLATQLLAAAEQLFAGL